MHLVLDSSLRDQVTARWRENIQKAEYLFLKLVSSQRSHVAGTGVKGQLQKPGRGWGTARVPSDTVTGVPWDMGLQCSNKESPRQTGTVDHLYRKQPEKPTNIQM